MAPHAGPMNCKTKIVENGIGTEALGIRLTTYVAERFCVLGYLGVLPFLNSVKIVVISLWVYAQPIFHSEHSKFYR